MNIIQMLNSWRWVSKEVETPLVNMNHYGYPYWFWIDHTGGGYSFFKPKLEVVIGMEIGDWKEEELYPIYYWGDKNDCYISIFNNNPKRAKETYRNWLTEEENKELGIRRCS